MWVHLQARDQRRFDTGVGIILCGDCFATENSEGEKFATLVNPKAHTASRTHCTANVV